MGSKTTRVGFVFTEMEEPPGQLGQWPNHFPYQTSKKHSQLELVLLLSLMVGYCNQRLG